MLPKIFYSLKDNPGKRSKLIVLLGVSVVAGFILFSDHGIVKRFSLENQKTELEERIKSEYKTKAITNKVIKKLRTDTLEIERIAREKYGMVKPGEEVFHVTTKSEE